MTRKGFQGLTLTGAAGSKALQVLQYRARARKTVRRVHLRVNKEEGLMQSKAPPDDDSVCEKGAHLPPLQWPGA